MKDIEAYKANYKIYMYIYNIYAYTILMTN